MYKKLQKTFAIALLLVMLMATTCFAENDAELLSSEPNSEETAVTVQENSETSSEDFVADKEEDSDEASEVTTTGENADEDGDVAEEEATADEEEEMLQDDLYLFQTDVDYSRIVDGNAYVIGNNVTFSSVVGGDVFILGNNITIDEKALIYGNLYVMGNTVTLNGFVYGGDLYAMCSELIINENAAVNRDIRAVASKFTHNGGTGRNIYVTASEISVGETAQIYGNLNYSSKEAIQIPAGVVQGDINFSEIKIDKENPSNLVMGYVMDVVYTLIYTIVILGVLIFVAPKFLGKLEGSEIKLLPVFGFGLATLVLPIIAAIVLMITYVGAPVGFALIAVWAVLVFILAKPVATIAIAGMLANKIEFLKKAHNILAVVISTVVIWAIGFIPVVGGIIAILIDLFGLGLIVKNVFSNRKKVEESQNQ